MVMVRAFVALELSADIQEQLRAVQDSLRGCRARLTLVDPALIHITVKFLGEVDDRTIPKISAALQQVRFEAFPVTAGKVTVNNPHNPRTVWSVIEDNGKSRQLFSRVEEVLEPLGFAKETRPFTPHATIARVKTEDPSLRACLDLFKDRTYGMCTIFGLKLKKSTLTSQGPIYEDLMEVTW
ncbi:MAG: RNA 2',3'-cyclic phosphodiesterase [Methanoregula sp.]